jgi:hypothetical protein
LALVHLMDVIHFTEGATDPLLAFRARLARLVPIAEGPHVRLSCLNLASDAAIIKPPTKKACVLLLVHGQIDFWMTTPTSRLELTAGVGVTLEAGERNALQSKRGAILMVIESDDLHVHPCGISTPERIQRAQWPGYPLDGDSLSPDFNR